MAWSFRTSSSILFSWSSLVKEVPKGTISTFRVGFWWFNEFITNKMNFVQVKSSLGIDWIRDTWWRHKMEAFSALLAICAKNSPVPGECPAQRPVMRSFDVFFDLRLNKRLSKQSRGWWFETLSRSLWRHCNALWSKELITAAWLPVPNYRVCQLDVINNMFLGPISPTIFHHNSISIKKFQFRCLNSNILYPILHVTQ